ncbi:hypothetical protein PR048_006690 [Dryococelus australis]|uniref:Uncharacterized protein n=1 Tax=Dryococelus australis TaxID=614101 RepID=A0ABQ9IBN2_9NEOP|nr:hypothetical protein PR048_006690 [Dryococelus australis]
MRILSFHSEASILLFSQLVVSKTFKFAVGCSKQLRREAIERKNTKENEEANKMKTTMAKLTKLEVQKRKLLIEAEEEASALQKKIDLERKKLKNMKNHA